MEGMEKVVWERKGEGESAGQMVCVWVGLGQGKGGSQVIFLITRQESLTLLAMDRQAKQKVWKKVVQQDR